MKPEVFAPGIVSTSDHEASYPFISVGGVFVFDRWSSSRNATEEFLTYMTEIKDGMWTRPPITDFLKRPCDDSLAIIPGHDMLYFGSRRSRDGRAVSPRGFNIWIARRTVNGFSDPRMLDPPVNSNSNDTYPSATKDGTIYFFSDRDGGLGREDIYRSRLINGQYADVENLGGPINTQDSEIDPFVAPDESYLIYCSRTLGGHGEHDLYVSFRTQDGSWTEPINMGAGINSPGDDWIPNVTPDGRYFFFTSNRTGDYDVYWVDAGVIQTFGPEKPD